MIKIYGIDESDFRCYGCWLAKKLLDESKLKYEFIKCVTKDEEGFPSFNLDAIDEAKDKAGFTSRSITYPVIFFDDEHIKLRYLATKLKYMGYDVDDLND